MMCRQVKKQAKPFESNLEKLGQDNPEIVDYKVSMLIATGAAMAANCEPCLNKAIPELIEAGVCEADIRRAVEIGQFVKDRPAAIMKEAADLLTGTNLLAGPVAEGCPSGAMKQRAS